MEEQNRGARHPRGQQFCRGSPLCLLQATLTMESARQTVAWKNSISAEGVVRVLLEAKHRL